MRPFVPVKVDARGRRRRTPGRAVQGAHPGILPRSCSSTRQSTDPKGRADRGQDPRLHAGGVLRRAVEDDRPLPKDIDKLVAKAHPDDGDAMRLLATALAMQGRTKEAIALINRAWGPAPIPDFDRWAAVYSTLGDEVMHALETGRGRRLVQQGRRCGEAADRRLQCPPGRRLRRDRSSARATWPPGSWKPQRRVVGVAGGERDFAKELLGMLAKPLDGSAGVPEAVAAMKRLEADHSSQPGNGSPSDQQPSPPPK